MKNRDWVLLLVLQITLAPALHADDAARVEVAPVIAREVAAGHSFVGSVVPRRSSVVGSAVDGRVQRVLFEEGDLVKLVKASDNMPSLGQPLVQLRTRTIEIELQAGRAELELRQQERAQLRKQLPEEVKQGKAKLASARAVSNFTKSKYMRTKRLFEAGQTATQAELDEANSAYIAAQQAQAAAQSAADQVEATKEARLKQSDAKVAVQRETVARLEDIASKYTIRAPFRGFVTKKLTEVGEWISKGEPVAEVIQLDTVEIDVPVPEKYIVHLRKGAKVRILLEALPAQSFSGTVSRIVPQADRRSRAFPVKITVPNPDYLIKAGMLARVTMPVGSPKPALLVPKDALVLAPKRRSVVVAMKDGDATVAKHVRVTDGAAHGELIEIIGSLKPGDHVVVRGNERLKPGQKLRVIASPKPDTSVAD